MFISWGFLLSKRSMNCLSPIHTVDPSLANAPNFAPCVVVDKRPVSQPTSLRAPTEGRFQLALTTKPCHIEGCRLSVLGPPFPELRRCFFPQEQRGVPGPEGRLGRAEREAPTTRAWPGHPEGRGGGSAAAPGGEAGTRAPGGRAGGVVTAPPGNFPRGGGPSPPPGPACGAHQPASPRLLTVLQKLPDGRRRGAQPASASRSDAAVAAFHAGRCRGDGVSRRPAPR